MNENETAEAIAARYWESLLALTPTLATAIGDERYDDRLDDPSPAGRQAIRDLHRATLSELDTLEAAAQQRGGLAAADGETADVLRFMCTAELGVEESDYPLLESVDQLEGPQTRLSYLASEQPTDTSERLERWLARLAAYPAFVDAHVDRIAEARARGVTPARIVAERVIEQLGRMLATAPEQSAIVTVPVVAGDPERARIAAAVREHVLPALARLRDAVRVVLPHAREQPGLVAVPGGDRMYAARTFLWTTLGSDPDDLHRFGWSDLEAIERDRQAIVASAGFADGDTAAYRRALAEDPRNAPRTPGELLGRIREDMARAIDASPRYFGGLPRAACEVRPLDDALADDSLGHYIQPTPDGSRPGVFYMTTTDLPSRLFTRYATITYHETIPGHHFQLATESERESLSPFRRLGARYACGAFVEGWALYAERLADEMGLFRSEGERFGMLDAQAWRAARLVVDTGIHAYGWDRERAVDEFERWSGFDRPDAEIEVDRYIAMPAQALAYKVGQREIEALRRTAEASATFDLRRFHDEVLGHGSLPLDVLRAGLPAWLDA